MPLMISDYYRVTNVDSAFYSHYSLWCLLLVLLIGLIAGRLLKKIIYSFPTRLKRRWKRECENYLRHASSLESSGAECTTARNKARFILPGLVRRYVKRSILKALSGKCSYREKPKSILYSYPIIELVTILITLLVSCYFFALSLPFFGALLFSYALIVLMFIDFNELLLPDEITLLLLWCGLAFNLNNYSFVSLNDAVIGAILGYLLLWSFYWLIKCLTGVQGLGYGDFKLMAALGAWLGWQSLHEIVLLGSIIGLAGVVAVYFLKDKTILNKPIPFGSCLSLAGIVFLFEPNLSTKLLAEL